MDVYLSELRHSSYQLQGHLVIVKVPKYIFRVMRGNSAPNSLAESDVLYTKVFNNK
jgi:hypothetical protein